MAKESTLFEREPAAVIGSITGLIQAGGTMLLAFGFDLTVDQLAAIMTAANALLVVIGSFVIRSQVWSPASVEVLTESAGTRFAQEGDPYSD